MEKRALVAIVLSVAVMAIWQIFFVPPPPAQAPEPPAASSPAEGPGGEPVAGGRQTTPPDAPPAAAADPIAQETVAAEAIQADASMEFRLVTDTQDIRLTNEGGRALLWRLTRYTHDGAIPVDLLSEQARAAGVLPLQIEVPGDPELTRRLATALHVHEETSIGRGDPSGLGPGRRLTFTWADGLGLAVRKTLELPDEGYLGRVSFEVTRDGRPLPATLIWASGLAEPSEEDGTVRYGHVEGHAVLGNGGRIERVAPKDVDQERIYGPAAGGRIQWAGLESTYFVALLLPPAGNAGADALTVALTPRHAPGTGTEAPPVLTAGVVSSGSGEFRLYVGPKDYDRLVAMQSGLERVINFSRFAIIYEFTKWLFIALTWINSYIGNYGWSIILLTFLLRLVFFPITYKSMITMRQTSKKMSKVQPKVKAIQERYRKMKKSMETQRKMNEEIMALYKREGVNPMSNLGGCLPLLLQMPIFIAFYNLLSVTIEMRQAPFIGWLTDLSRRDPYYITPVLMGASWLLQQAMTSSSIPDPMQRRMMMLMPVMFTFFMMNMPSGLVVYWLTSNVLGMVQQYLTNRKADHLEAEAREKGDTLSRTRRAEDGQTA